MIQSHNDTKPCDLFFLDEGLASIYCGSASMYRGLSYSSCSRQPECQLGTTSKWNHFTCTHDSILPMSNIGCPLGPCVPAVMTCLGCPSPSSSRFTPALAASTTNYPRASFPAHMDLM